MNWKFIKHRDLLTNDGLRIAQLKNQHWPYGIESQLSWMDKSIHLDDLHLLGISDNGIELIAYTTISMVKVTIDDLEDEYFGIGGVCVSKAYQHHGLGYLLTKETSDYIRNCQKQGILLCKNELVPFYEKNGWYKMDYHNATVADTSYKRCIMLLDKKETCINVEIDRNF